MMCVNYHFLLCCVVGVVHQNLMGKWICVKDVSLVFVPTYGSEDLSDYREPKPALQWRSLHEFGANSTQAPPPPSPRPPDI